MYNLLNTADYVLNKLANSPAAEKLTPELSSLFSHEFTYKSPPPNTTSKIILTPDRTDWLGYITVDNRGEIRGIEVNPKFRRKGYGSQLLGSVPQAKTLYVEDADEEAKKFYTKQKWEDTGDRGHFSERFPEKEWDLFRRSGAN